MAKTNETEKDKPEAGTAIAAAQTQALAVIDDYGADAGAGMENVSRDEVKIPFLRILQALSPACKPVERGGIEGAKPGMIMNTNTREIFDPAKDEIVIMPAARGHNFVEFPPRTGGGTGVGFQGAYEPDDPLVKRLRANQSKFGRLKHDNGNEITEVYYLYCIVVINGGAPFRAMVGFSLSQVPVYQGFIGMQQSIQFKVAGPDGQPRFVNPPMWAIRWRLGTAMETKKENDYYNWRLSMAEKGEDGRPSALNSLLKKSDPLYDLGAAFYQLIKSGDAAIDYNAAQTDDEAQTGGAEPSGQPADVGEDIPF